MKRYLANLNDSKIPPDISYINEISNDEFCLCEKSIQIIDETEHLKDLFIVHKLNFQELINFQTQEIKDILSDTNNHLNIGNDKYTSLKIEFNRLLINYLSSFRMFIDHCERKINNRFGNKSPEFSDFKLMTNQLYDDLFAYRFLYELRNFCQHCGIAVTDMEFRNQGELTEIKFQFEREFLLSDFKKWKPNVLSDLENMEEKFNINPIVNNHFLAIKDLSEKIHLLYKEKFISALKNLNNFTCSYRKQNELVIIQEKNKTELGMQLIIKRFPFDLIDKFLNDIR